MYAAFNDPYCYPGTNVLINKLGIRDGAALEAFEEEISRQRAAEPLPAGRLSISHFLAVHRHLFQDVYAWAGKPRTVRLIRQDSVFAYPEHIRPQLKALFGWLRSRRFLQGLDEDAFAAGAAHLLAELNAIHTFRDGNGRAQLAFLLLLAETAGHPLHLGKLEPDAFLAAMIASFRGDESRLAAQIAALANF
jgi:cell filamentation protein